MKTGITEATLLFGLSFCTVGAAGERAAPVIGRRQRDVENARKTVPEKQQSLV